MKFAASTLFLGLSFVLHSIELISSQPRPELAEPTDLKTLFPGSNGFHFPDIEKLDHAEVRTIPNFTVFISGPVSQLDVIYIQRGRVIFGYILGPIDTGDDEIECLCQLFPRSHSHVVFNRTTRKWYTLSIPEVARLGVNRSLPLVLAHDKAQAYFYERDHDTNRVAHEAASEHAYYRSKEYESLLRAGSDTKEQRVQKLQDRYQRSYNAAYRCFSGQHICF